MNIAIIGATGLVGRTMLRVLEQRDTPVNHLVLAASARSAGTMIDVRDKPTVVRELSPDVFDGIDYALFSAGGNVSREFAPIAASRGCVVIDNSSAWRMDPNVPLVVPEVNPDDAFTHRGVIANPNCSTIQLVVALKPLADAFGLRRVVVSTYQSPSGAGQTGIDQMNAELGGRQPVQRISPHQIAGNTVFHNIDNVDASSEEEIKVMRETRRILHNDHLPLAVTCVRVPVIGGHGESVAIETVQPCPPDAVRQVLASSPGVVVLDDPANAVYPTTVGSNEMDSVYVGRIRPDTSVDNGVMLWVVADNLRKGAATNAIQILELLEAHR
ncbi:MAG: aspartate-semialdehyde dehydrogenase [Candidatus Kapabacteria bacterium]|nr:aspartate-semialdehyde dehydrogenase [Candidatus Kapabacteria bacterium]